MAFDAADHNGHDHNGHGHDHNGHGHGHGHANDQGLKAFVRYLRHAPSMWHSEINEAVVELAAPTPGERGLDIGAGMGPGAVLAAGRGARVVAVEPTPFMRRILQGRRRLSRHGSRIEVSDGAAEQLPTRDKSIDVLWAVNTMHHCVDPDVAAGEIARVLKSGGRLVLVDEDFNHPDHPEHDKFGGADHGPEHHGFTMVDAGQMGDRLSAHGLVEVEAVERLLGDRPVIAVTASAP
ncbi:MAG: methyltransferase domain-containing protein [Actinomycetota bacterium]